MSASVHGAGARGAWKIDRERRSLADLRRDANAAAVPLERAVHDGEAEPGSLGFRAEERLEDLRGRFLRHARAVVRHGDPEGSVVDRSRLDFDVTRVVVADGLARVLHEIDDDLPELIFVDFG